MKKTIIWNITQDVTKDFLNYKNLDNNYLFIRIINYKGFTFDGKKYDSENIEQNYSEKNYNDLIKHLPNNSEILLITHHEISNNDKNKFYSKFHLLDNIILPDLVFYGDKMDFKDVIIYQYNLLFKYIENNFNKLDDNDMIKIINKDIIIIK